MRANAAADEKDRLPEEEVIAQMSLVSRAIWCDIIELTDLENVHHGRIGYYLECALAHFDRSGSTPGTSAKAEARAAGSTRCGWAPVRRAWTLADSRCYHQGDTAAVSNVTQKANYA